ncbi:hypothetical protein MAA8898_04837 [Maliponia aquimaris]|uniref:Molybdopterin-guanine dinucleotide biosynthesis protein MobA n=1 Tax=Maliponia aquimaris TaxID=1673631 RepID=A0A238L607_9RHOB|nr:hypothetical protein MAA8898_04837 [Maliponia aquimaris]
MSQKIRVQRNLPLGVVLRRAPGVTRWARWVWTASGVLPGAGPAEWREMRREGEVTEYHAATLSLDLYGSDTEAYLHELCSQTPSVYVVLRKTDAEDIPLEVLTVTVSPYDAQDYADSGEEMIEKVPMPPALLAWVAEFVEEFHEEEVFIKRKRDKLRVDLVQDGIGDPRIGKPEDVYASPALRRRRLQ